MDWAPQTLLTISGACLSVAGGIAGASWSVSKLISEHIARVAQSEQKVEALSQKVGRLEGNTEDAEHQSAQAQHTAALVLQAHEFLTEDHKATQERFEKALNLLKIEFTSQINDSHLRLRELLEALTRRR